MRKKIFEILFLSLLVLGFNGIRQANGQTIFNDDFESPLYQQWTFPTAGGWQLLFNGSGNIDQHIDISHAVSDLQSLRLEGNSCWSAFAYHPITLPTKVTLQVNVYLDSNVSCGCGPTLAEFAFFNPSIGSAWGTGFGGVSFNCDGFIHGGDDGDINNGGSVKLMHYLPNNWYTIRIDLDMDNRVSSVYVNGALLSSGIKINPSVSGAPTGVVLCGGYSINNAVWYDDVCVLEMLTPSPTPPPTPIAATLSAGGFLHIPDLMYSTLINTINLWADMQSVSHCNPPDICFKVTSYGTN
ncbi:MAG: hypothetical protein HY881_26035 [Deltaproteobacteria bacterium]|nr:hypothetical protein [Deltaproteobacteria bacterium]